MYEVIAPPLSAGVVHVSFACRVDTAALTTGAVGAPAVTGPLAAETAVDPVCGMEVTAAPPTASADREGVTYWFCCDGCRSTFLAEVAG